MKRKKFNISFETAKELVTKNFLLKVLSLVIAVSLWSYVAGERNVQIGLTVPLELRNIPSGLIVTNKLDRQVELTVAGPKNLLNFINTSGTSAILDLSSSKEGKNIYHLSIRNFNIPKDILIKNTYPDRIEIYLEKYLRKSVKVVPRIKGYSKIKKRISSLNVDPSSITIEGPEIDLKKIKTVETESVVLSREEGEEDIDVPVKVKGRLVRPVGDGVVTVRIKFASRGKE